MDSMTFEKIELDSGSTIAIGRISRIVRYGGIATIFGVGASPCLQHDRFRLKATTRCYMDGVRVHHWLFRLVYRWMY